MKVLEQTGSREWRHVPATEVSDVIVAAMAAGGIDHLFFTSGAELVFYQEAIAKARADGSPAPRLIVMTHEHAALNAALGYAMVSGKPAATCAHVDAGTLNYGGAIHSAWRSGLPVLITAGGGPTAYAGSTRGARDSGGHIWMQSPPDQNGIVRQYVKWDHRLAQHENAGLIVSRALQMAQSVPRGPVYLTIPKEVALISLDGASFPTAEQLGIARLPPPACDALAPLVERLVAAERPVAIVAASGQDPESVAPLVALCESLGVGVVEATPRPALSFPFRHPLRQPPSALREADVVLVIEAPVPWIPGPEAPTDDAFVAVIGADAAFSKIPVHDFTANVRLVAEPCAAIEAIVAVVQKTLRPVDEVRIAERRKRLSQATEARRTALVASATSSLSSGSIDSLAIVHELAKLLTPEMIVVDETLPPATAGMTDLFPLSRPGSYFGNPGTSGGWGPGAAFGAKLAAPERDVVLITGDGFYQYGTASNAIWSARHYRAPFLTVIWQNRSYSTGTSRLRSTYPDSYAARAGYEGGLFDPPVDFAREAEAAGGYGETVATPSALPLALQRTLRATRDGVPAVVVVELPTLAT